MLVEAVLVDEIGVEPDGSSAYATATLYEFGEPQWVSTHSPQEGSPLGPLTMVGAAKDERLMDMRVRSFGRRPLHLDPVRHAVSYHDRWTAPPWSVYALVLPPHYVATVIDLQPPSAGYYNAHAPKLALSPDERIFYHVLFSQPERTSFDIRARLEADEAQYARLLHSAEVVAGTDKFAQLRTFVRDGAQSPDLWFKLLALGSKLWGAG